MKITTRTTGWKAGVMTDFFAFDNGATGEAAAPGYRQHPNRPGELPTTVVVREGGRFGFASMPHDWSPAVGDAVPAPVRMIG